MSKCRTEKDNQNIIIRLNRIEGQVKGLKNMIESDRDCMEIINQVASVSSALKGVWEILAAKHIQKCLANSEDKNNAEAIQDIISGLQKLR